MSANGGTFEVVVSKIEQVTPLIKVFTLVDPDGRSLPGFSGGSHIVVLIPGEKVIHRNPYSLMSSPFDTSSYQIGVRKQASGRGGSVAMHDRVKEGMRLRITHPVNNFPINKLGLRHIFIAGGVGITPVISQAMDLAVGTTPFEIHYGVRNPEHALMKRFIKHSPLGDVRVYHDSLSESMDFDAILADQPLGSHIYICGPESMITDAVAAAKRLGWSQSHVHWEEFTEQQTGEAFDVFLARSEVAINVPPELSLLEAIENEGVDIPYLCRGGACGQCETAVLDLEGELVHHDIWLSDEEKKQNKKIMPCVSRARCTKLVLDL